VGGKEHLHFGGDNPTKERRVYEGNNEGRRDTLKEGKAEKVVMEVGQQGLSFYLFNYYIAAVAIFLPDLCVVILKYSSYMFCNYSYNASQGL
jgi:hypothetical protein